MPKNKSRLRRADNYARARFFIKMLLLANLGVLLYAGYHIFSDRVLSDKEESPTKTQIKDDSNARTDPESLDSNETLERAATLIREGKMDDATRILNANARKLEKQEQLAEMHNLLGIVHMRAEENVEAVADFMHAISRNDTNIIYYINLNECLRRAGFGEMALAALEHVKRKNPDSILLEAKYMLTACEAGHEDQISRSIDEAVVDGRMPSHMALVRAAMIYRDGEVSEALQLMQVSATALPEELFNLLLQDMYIKNGLREGVAKGLESSAAGSIR